MVLTPPSLDQYDPIKTPLAHEMFLVLYPNFTEWTRAGRDPLSRMREIRTIFGIVETGSNAHDGMMYHYLVATPPETITEITHREWQIESMLLDLRCQNDPAGCRFIAQRLQEEVNKLKGEFTPPVIEQEEKIKVRIEYFDGTFQIGNINQSDFGIIENSSGVVSVVQVPTDTQDVTRTTPTGGEIVPTPQNPFIVDRETGEKIFEKEQTAEIVRIEIL